MLGVWWLGMSYEAFGVVTHANDFGHEAKICRQLAIE